MLVQELIESMARNKKVESFRLTLEVGNSGKWPRNCTWNYQLYWHPWLDGQPTQVVRRENWQDFCDAVSCSIDNFSAAPETTGPSGIDDTTSAVVDAEGGSNV